MSLRQNQADLEYFLQRGAALLGENIRPLTMEYAMRAYLSRHGRRVSVGGLGTELPVRAFHSGYTGNTVQFGLERYEIHVGDINVPLVRLVNPFTMECASPLEDLWGVPEQHYTRLYRFLRRGVRENVREVAPVMRPEDEKRLWDHTIGFLQKGEMALSRFGVPLKRGVLLMGEPGNGKTMAARWLYSCSLRLGLEWRTVRAEDYEIARGHGSAHDLFQLSRPGIILFDDLDTGIRNRDSSGSTRDHATFLSELDGIEIRCGVVYLFTTNARLKDLDPAFRRPGRIDHCIQFHRPDADLRRRLILEHWPAEIVAAIPVDVVVERTVDFTFAEVEELKKLLVLHYLDTDTWDWDHAWETFGDRTGTGIEDKPPLGFQTNGHSLPLVTR